MKTIGLVYQPARNDSTQWAELAHTYLSGQGIQVWRGTAQDEDGLRAVAPELDLVITFGGDGTIVRCVRTVAHLDLPILGINLGRLGFLAEIEPQQLEERLALLLQGHYRVEERMMLRAELHRGARLLLKAEAINDVVMARGIVSRMVHVAVDVDGHHAMTVDADGLVLATPTGSTAYSLAAGGPIVGPDLNCLIVTPIAAHLSFVNALVIPPTRQIVLRLERGEGAMLTVDGQIDMALKPGDWVSCGASQNTAQFVRFGSDGYFYESALRRLGWQERATPQ
jgi:NAD+ kinase